MYPLMLRITAGNKNRTINLGYRVKEDQWKDGQVIKHLDADIINGVIFAKLNEAKRYIADCSIKGIPLRIEFIGSTKTSHSFIEYLSHRAKQYENKGQIVMARKLRRFVIELKNCFKTDVLFDDITQDSLRQLDAYLIKAGNASNTRHKKFKFLRQFFGQAFDEGKTDARNPFKQYKIPLKPVKKEKLSKEEIEKIENKQLSEGPVNDARNLFMFSYLAKGSRFENCITLQHKSIKNGRINIQTNKGGKHISIKLHPRLKQILDQYPGKGIVFPYLNYVPDDPTEYLKAIDSTNVIVNRNLKVLAKLCKIKINLTFHLARHSFAFHLKEVSNNVNVIQDALGHSDQRTTQIYLKALGDEVLDVEMDKLYGSF